MATTSGHGRTARSAKAASCSSAASCRRRRSGKGSRAAWREVDLAFGTAIVIDSRTDTPSVAERIRPIKAGAPIVAAHFLGANAVLVLGEEALLLATREGEARSVPVHGGAILASAADADRI